MMRSAVLLVMRRGSRRYAGMMVRTSDHRSRQCNLRGRQQCLNLMARSKGHHSHGLRTERKAQKQQREAAKSKEVGHSF